MAEPAFKITEAMVEAVARARCERAGFSPDHPVHYEDGVSCRLRRDPIRDDIIGTKRRDGSIVEQWPTTPYWRWAYEHGVRADLELASTITGKDGSAAS